MAIPVANLLAGLPRELRDEWSERLAGREDVRVERIVSRGHASAPGAWYDQAETEWVVVVKGSARLRFEGDDAPVELGPGDHVTIPPHVRHRVEWTAPGEETVWVAVFY